MRCVALATSLVALALAQVAAGLDLETLLSPAHVPDFLAHTRFRTALHLDRGGENVYAEVLDPRNLAAVVAKALRVGELTQGDSLLLVRRTRAHGEEWTARWRGQVRSASDITQALSRGFSLVVNKFDRLWPRVRPRCGPRGASLTAPTRFLRRWRPWRVQSRARWAAG